uniref:hypothetical protein n=1 Tax=Sphingomonas sp. TaxID=28214 RepID=UPI0025E5D3C0|nr:hypothetical protein [Sphingomonas sp.]
MRRILGITLGMMMAIAVIWAFELVVQSLYPMPDSWQTASRGDVAAIMGDMPLGEKLIVVCGWFAGAFCGAWLALRICDWRAAGWVVPAVLIVAGIANLIALPHPLWMQVATFLAPMLGGVAASRFHRKPYRGEPLLG